MNTLVIGLGGTGVEVIPALKKDAFLHLGYWL